MRAKTIRNVLGGLAVLTVALAVWRVWLAPPVVVVSTQVDQVVVENILLGEYYLGFNEVMIRHRSSGQTIWHARQDEGEGVDGFSFRARLNKAPARWTVIEPMGSDTFTLAPGAEYQLSVWGNNGFAVITKWSGPLQVPSHSGP